MPLSTGFYCIGWIREEVTNMYAGRKRRKPAQKGVKPTPVEGAKSNPSKRHRDRLNSELDRLAGLLPFPEDVIASLDKLSILRLSVSYLRTKSFFSVALKDQLSTGINKSGDLNQPTSPDSRVPEGELLLQALNGFVLVVTAEGTIFFCSHTIQDYLGFHQTDVMHQSVFELIHTEDQQEFRRNLHWALNPPSSPLGPHAKPPDADLVPTTSCLVSYNPEQLPPENSSFLERGFICRFRCLLDSSSGFLALNIQGRLKFLHGQSQRQCDRGGGYPPQLALFAIATPLQPPAILEIRTRNMIFRTKHKLDFTPMACDAKGKIVLGYTEAELRVRGSGYQFIHAADMLYCAENHVRMIKTGESGLTVFRLLTKDNRWKWVQANARLVYKNGKPDYIIATQRPLADEEGGEHLRKRSMHLPFTFATGEALLYQTGFPLHGFPDAPPGKAKGGKSKKGKVDKKSSDYLDPKSLLGALMSQDESVYVCQPDTEVKMSYHSSLFTEQHNQPDGLLAGNSWKSVPNGEASECKGRMSTFDPLLATLDSLSLDGDESCSNSELFSALENLGLNAEDLELLLLDERMIQVELDPNHIPTLGDLLTNNEILSYIHDSLQADGNGSSPDLIHQPCLVPAIPVTQPIVELSQQMLQHVGAGEVMPINNQTSAPNGLWADPSNQQAVSATNHEHKQPIFLLESSPQWGQHNPVHLQGNTQDMLLNHTTANGFHTPNGHVDSVSTTPHALLNGSVTQDCQNLVATAPFCQPHSRHKQPSQVPPGCFPQGPGNNSALELEQLLALSSQPQRLPSLETYSIFSNTQDSSHSKLENGCLLSAANATYVRACLTPNGNSVTESDLSMSRPDALPALQDPQTSGLFL